MKKNNQQKNNIPPEFIESLSFETSEKQLKQLKELIFNSPDINKAKIEFIKEELAANRYEINSVKIATRLLEDSWVKSRSIELEEV